MATGWTRAEIRTDLVDRLTAAATAAGSRVYPSRLSPVAETEMPCLLVYVDRETDTNAAPYGQALMARETEITIEGYVSGTSETDLETDLDALVEEVRAATLGDAAFLARFTSVTGGDLAVDSDIGGETYVGGFALKLHARHHVGYP